MGKKLVLEGEMIEYWERDYYSYTSIDGEDMMSSIASFLDTRDKKWLPDCGVHNHESCDLNHIHCGYVRITIEKLDEESDSS